MKSYKWRLMTSKKEKMSLLHGWVYIMNINILCVLINAGNYYSSTYSLTCYFPNKRHTDLMNKSFRITVGHKSTLKVNLPTSLLKIPIITWICSICAWLHVYSLDHSLATSFFLLLTLLHGPYLRLQAQELLSHLPLFYPPMVNKRSNFY